MLSFPRKDIWYSATQTSLNVVRSLGSAERPLSSTNTTAAPNGLFWHAYIVKTSRSCSCEMLEMHFVILYYTAHTQCPHLALKMKKTVWTDNFELNMYEHLIPEMLLATSRNDHLFINYSPGCLDFVKTTLFFLYASTRNAESKKRRTFLINLSDWGQHLTKAKLYQNILWQSLYRTCAVFKSYLFSCVLSTSQTHVFSLKLSCTFMFASELCSNRAHTHSHAWPCSWHTTCMAEVF